jgi:hypothetical protein
MEAKRDVGPHGHEEGGERMKRMWLSRKQRDDENGDGFSFISCL